jgi:hypothetical protein
MKGSDLALIAAGLGAAYFLFTDNGKAALAQLTAGAGGADASGQTGGAALGGTVSLNPSMLQAKYDEFNRNGLAAAAALQNIPTNQYTRNSPTALPFTASELQQQQAGLIRLGEAIGTVGVIAPKYTPNATIAIGNGNYIQTDASGNVVHDSSAIINQGAGQQAYNATVLSGGSATAAVEAKRQAELKSMGSHD